MTETFLPRVMVGISGASGACYGIRALEMLAQLGAETHCAASGHCPASPPATRSTRTPSARSRPAGNRVHCHLSYPIFS